LLLKLSFSTASQLSNFFNLLPIIQTYLPPHVYIITYLKLQLMTDDLANLNTGLSIPLFESQTFSLDGSSSISGTRPSLAEADDNYYKDYRNRLFCISVGPYRNPIFPHYPNPNPSVDDQPLHTYDNLDELPGNNSGFIDGKLRTYIPLAVIPPGQSTSRRPSTREVPAILLIDF